MELVEIKGVIEMETGTPLPVVISVNGRTAVTFYKQTDDRPDMPVERNTVDIENVCSLIFDSCLHHTFGMPNDETLYGHPYAKLGLGSYAFYELKSSDLIQKLLEIDKIHPQFNEKKWLKYKHYILTFHDEMFECIAGNFTIRELKKSVQDQAAALLSEFTK